MAQAFNYADDYKQLSNWNEIIKFKVLCGLWLVFIFGLTWVVCYAVGVGLPWGIYQIWPNASSMVGETFHALIPILAILVFIPFNAMLLVLMERRALALFTVRRGPCRVGPDGALQTAADAIKLLLKEDVTPTGADAVMFTAAPVIFFAPSIFAAVPLLAAATNNNAFFQVVNVPTGIFYVLAAASIPVVGIVMGGWASNNKYSLVGGLRSAAQAISYEIPLVLSLISICVLNRSLDVVKIAQMQAGGLLHWNILGGGSLGLVLDAMGGNTQAQNILHSSIGYQGDIPALLAAIVLSLCTIIMAGMYLTGACAEINRIPFDLPEAESELVSGYNTEYSGIKFAIFFLAEFTNLFVVSTIFAVMFLGGGDFILPSSWFAPAADAFDKIIRPAIDIHFINPDTFWAAIWLIVKVYALVFFAILIRGTLPRFRIDQLMDFGWKRLIPITLAVFMLIVFLKVLVATPAGAPVLPPQ